MIFADTDAEFTDTEKRLLMLYCSDIDAEKCSDLTAWCCSGIIDIIVETIDTLRQALPDIFDPDDRAVVEGLIMKLDSTSKSADIDAGLEREGFYV